MWGGGALKEIKRTIRAKFIAVLRVLQCRIIMEILCVKNYISFLSPVMSHDIIIIIIILIHRNGAIMFRA